MSETAPPLRSKRFEFCGIPREFGTKRKHHDAMPAYQHEFTSKAPPREGVGELVADGLSSHIHAPRATLRKRVQFSVDIYGVEITGDLRGFGEGTCKAALHQDESIDRFSLSTSQAGSLVLTSCLRLPRGNMHI